MNFRVFLFFLLAIGFTACNDSESSPTEEIIQPLPDRAAEVIGVDEDLVPDHLTPGFWKVLKVHGTLERWQQQRAVSFTLRDFPTGGKKKLTDRHWVNLDSRKHLIEGDEYRVVFDGKATHAVPDLHQTGFPPHMYQAASFFMLGMPFVLANENFTVTDAGMAEVDGHVYKQFNVRIPENVGDGGNDYQLYVYPDTEVLRFASWDLKYPSLENQGLWQIADFPSWQEKNGVLVPEVVRLYTASEEITTDTEPDIFFYDEVQFSTTSFDEARFRVPENAVKDTSTE